METKGTCRLDLLAKLKKATDGWMGRWIEPLQQEADNSSQEDDAFSLRPFQAGRTAWHHANSREASRYRLYAS